MPGHYALLGFQKMRFGTRHDVRFTINLLACAHAEWAALVEENPHYGPEPMLGARYGERVWTKRIGFLMPEPHDHCAVPREVGVPALRAHLPVT